MKSTFNPVRKNGRGGGGSGCGGRSRRVCCDGRRGGGLKECCEGGGMLIEGAEERKEMGGVLWEMKGEERGEIPRQCSDRNMSLWACV